ncbi:MAG: glycine--tRNA ligase [Patescibacteria group bacterium]|nr:glycine--tRNA ligase [Patescibacteria group bacterium]
MTTLERIIQICKQRGFIFNSAEIYGGLKGFYDFGHLGVLLKNNIKNLWLKDVVFSGENIFLVESALIGPRKIYEASGHLENFYDLLVECKNCHNRFRADHLLKGEYGEVKIKDNRALCPLCEGELTEQRTFNLMFKTNVGPVEELSSEAYLRPETAQGIFYNFKNVLTTMRAKLPFGIAQIGKSFRNEITPRNFIFRMREFEQMELEFFTYPEEANKWFDYWAEKRFNFYLKLGFKDKNIRQRVYSKEELAHYSSATIDIEYNFPWGFDELEGIANRTDYDLKSHNKFSESELFYFDEKRKEKIIPYVIEPSVGIERLLLAVLLEFYDEDKIEGETRKIFRFPPSLAPFKVAVFPLLNNRPELVSKARKVYSLVKKNFQAFYDENGSIGRRYRRQDEIGTPFCLTIDFQTLEDETITIRNRDTTKQERIKITNINSRIRKLINKFR